MVYYGIMNAIETLRSRVQEIKRAGEIERVDRVVDALAAQALGTSQILVDHLLQQPVEADSDNGDTVVRANDQI